MSVKNRMNILYCMDESKKDYSRFLGVSIISLLENNKEEDICIYVLTTKIEDENKKELKRIVESYDKSIIFSNNKEIIPGRIKNILYKTNTWHISTYYRLFFNNNFPEIKDRLLYLDCDTIVNGNISTFYNIPFNDNVLVGQLDIPLTRYESHKNIGTDINNYINAGVILINIQKYNEYNMEEEINRVNTNYNIKYCDQDYLNLIFKGKILLYNGLQTIILSEFDKIGKSLVIHTVAKPQPFSHCPSKVCKLFNYYLDKTKWKDYYKNNYHTFITYSNIYYYFRNFIIYICERLFGINFALRVRDFYPIAYLKSKLIKSFSHK